MDTQILKLEPPFEYIYCNGEVGKHIATYIVGETKVDENGNYQLVTHSHPIVKYWNAPQGVVWDRAELTDCEVLCDDRDKRVSIFTFTLLCTEIANRKNEEEEEKASDDIHFYREEPRCEAEELKEKLQHYGIGFKTSDGEEVEETELDLEVNTCREGYYALATGDEFFFFDFVEPTLEELAKTVNEDRKYWEEFFDHLIKIRFTPESSFAPEFLEML